MLPLEHAADHLNVPAFFRRGFAIGEDEIDNAKLAALKEGTLAGKRGLTDLGHGFSFLILYDFPLSYTFSEKITNSPLVWEDLFFRRE